MTREIKFRAVNKLTNEIYKIQGFEIREHHIDLFVINKDVNVCRWLFNVEDIILQQYTGLKDKNGKEIYEGDVVKNHWNNIHGKDIGSNWIVKHGLHSCTGNDYYSTTAYGWYGDCGKEEHCLATLPTNSGCDDIEVIGNIYENPEFLNSESTSDK